jgi:hypothetical protein
MRADRAHQILIGFGLWLINQVAAYTDCVEREATRDSDLWFLLLTPIAAITLLGLVWPPFTVLFGIAVILPLLYVVFVALLDWHRC